MKAETVTAISAATIALASFFVSIWNAVQTRRHNRLSVIPHLRIDFLGQPDGQVKIILSNNGIGTALIKSFAVHLNSAAIGRTGLVEAFQGVCSTDFYVYLPSSDDALSAGEQVNLLSFNTSQDDFEGRTMIETCASQIIFKMRFESLYGESYHLNRTATGNMPQKQV